MNILPTIIKQEEVSKQNTSDIIRKPYDYFSTKIPRSHIEMVLKAVKDERFLFFIKYGLLRRYDGDCEIIYVEIPQIPKKLVIYRRPCIRMKSPEKINLSNRDLPHIPLFEGEENLKVLSLEMNQITKIDQLISLSNLSYLNLYCNKIKEIENLQTTSHLRVLLLGKNLIEKIKNVHILVNLEILDLHSNQIKLIENLSQLRKLRILNIANNQIASLAVLIVNRSLEELNARKNLIWSLPNLTNNWERMKKINLGKNQISKVDYLFELRKVKSLLEVSLEDNPVVLIKESEEILRIIPKVNLAFSNKNLLLISGNSKNVIDTSGQQPLQETIKHRRSSSPLAVIATNHKINLTNSLTCVGSSGRNSVLISKDQYSQMNNTHSIIKSIESKWLYEYAQIIKLGYNGYNNKKIKEAKAIFGHIECSNDKKELTCYGDVLRVLFHDDTYYGISSIHFHYFDYDLIMNCRNVERFQKFKELHCVSFCENNLHSFYQLTKLEMMQFLKEIVIKNNEVISSSLTKYFLIYRLPSLKRFNDEDVNEDDGDKATGLFEYFDQCISYCDAISNENKQLNNEKPDIDHHKEKSKHILSIDAYPSVSEGFELKRTKEVNVRNSELNGKDESILKEEANNKSIQHQHQYTKQDTLTHQDRKKMKMFSYVKSNLDLIMKEIIYDFMYDE